MGKHPEKQRNEKDITIRIHLTCYLKMLELNMFCNNIVKQAAVDDHKKPQAGQTLSHLLQHLNVETLKDIASVNITNKPFEH